MKYSYKIVLDKSQDAWNWLDVSRNPVFQGYNWRDNLSGDFLKFFDKIVKSPKNRAKIEINNFLDSTYDSNKDFYEKQIKQIDSKFSKKFPDACAWLEATTKKPLKFTNYKIFLTTFPRSPYNPDKGYFWFNIYGDTNRLAGTFLHEVLHFQFIYYWRNNPKSSVSKLSFEQFDLLKEALTVIIDDGVKPLIEEADRGYPAHQEFRKILHDYWKKHHDFSELVEYGVAQIKNEVKS